MSRSRVLLVGIDRTLPAGTTVTDCREGLAAAFPDRSVEVYATTGDAAAALDEAVACVVSEVTPDGERLDFFDRVGSATGEAPVVGLLAPGTEAVPTDVLTTDVAGWCRPAEHEDPVEALERTLPIVRGGLTGSDLTPFGPETNPFRQLVERIPDPVYLLDPSGYIEMVNEALIEEGGYDRDDLVDSHVSRVMTDDAIARGAEVIVELLDDPERTSGTIELEIIHDDGTHREYEDHISVITDEDGSLVGSVGIVRDIQERKERERELEQYEMIVETVPEGVFVLDENGDILAANEQCREIFGISSVGEQRLPLNFAELVTEGRVDPDVIDGYQAVVRDLLSSDSDADHGTYRYTVYPDLDESEPRTVEARVALRPYDEEFRGTIGVIEDVTEREQRIVELERYETIMQAVPDPVYATNVEGYITFLNDAARETYGYTDAEIESRSVHFSDVVDDDDIHAFRKANRQLLSSEYDDGRKAVIRYTAVTKDGRRFPAENHYALMTSDGTSRGGAGISRDISDRKQREQRLHVLDRILRHNLRNDLNAVMGNAELLERRLRDRHADRDGVDLARSIQHQSDRLVEMSKEIRQIQQALERDRTDRSTIDAVDLVECVLEPFQSAVPDVSIETDLTDRALVEGDETLELALANLVENAIEHHDHDDPEVHVGIRERQSDRGDWYELTVADDGPGIPEQERIALETDAEVTPLQHGSGIGLWAVAWIVSSFDGHVEIDDRDPRGTVVTMELRRAD